MLILQNPEWIKIIALAAVFVAVFMISKMILSESERSSADENLNLGDRKSSNGLVRMTRPFFNQYIVPSIRGKKRWDAKRIEYRRKMIAAGIKDELTADEFIAFKFFLIAFFPIVLTILNLADFLDTPWWVGILAGILGFFYPDFWVKGLIERRQREILRAMPFIVDLLALSTEAGLDFVGAIAKVVEKAKRGPLVEELEQVLKEIRVGSFIYGRRAR
jgi:tight adherence protein C